MRAATGMPCGSTSLHRRRAGACLAVLLASACAAGGALAADAGAASAAIFRLQGSVQRLTQENAELKARVEAQAAELQALRASAQAATSVAATADEVAAVKARYEQNTATLNEGLGRARAQILELAGKYREVATTLREVERDRADAVAARDRHLVRSLLCESQNDQVRDLALGLLADVEDRGVWDALLEAEPFSQVRRVQFENTVDAYRQKIEALYADVGGVPMQMPAGAGAGPAGSDPAGPVEAPPGLEVEEPPSGVDEEAMPDEPPAVAVPEVADEADSGTATAAPAPAGDAAEAPAAAASE